MGFFKKDFFIFMFFGFFIESLSGKVLLYVYLYFLNNFFLIKELKKLVIYLVCYFSGIVKFGLLRFLKMFINIEIYL